MPFTRPNDYFGDLELEPTPDPGVGVPNASGTTDGSVATKLFAGVDDDNPFDAGDGSAHEADFSGLFEIDFDGAQADDTLFNTPVPGPLPSVNTHASAIAVIDEGDELLDPQAVLKQLGASETVTDPHATHAEVLGRLNMRVLRTMELQGVSLEVRQKVAAQLPAIGTMRDRDEASE